MLLSHLLNFNRITICQSHICNFHQMKRISITEVTNQNDSLNINKLSELCLKRIKYTQKPRNNIRQSFGLQIRYNFCKIQSYVNQYQNLKVQIQQKKQKLKHLQQKLHVLRQMSQMSFSEHLLKQLYSLVGKNYETKGFLKQKQVLIDLRNQLQKKIEQSSLKWQQPRKSILQQREKKVYTFLVQIIRYEGQMAQFIKKRQSNNQEHLADINEGLVLTHKLLVKNIQKEGALLIEPQTGQNFNPLEHQLQSNSDNKTNKKLTIKNVTIPGWKLKDQIIRKAKVIVN